MSQLGKLKLVDTLRIVVDITVCTKSEEGIVVEEGSNLTFATSDVGSPHLPFPFF